jgi:hypothetical protein
VAIHPIDAVPLQAVCLRGGVARPIRLSGGAPETMNPAAALPPEPAWIRETLELPAGLPLRFILGKRIQHSDISAQQSRFMVPRAGANGRLLPLLSPDECRAAGLHEAWERPKPQPSGGEHDGEKTRVQGKDHGGLVVPVLINRTGRLMDAKLTRWDSTGGSRGTVLKFRDSKSFADESGLRKDDVIQIWAFRLYGRLHLVIAKIDSETTTAATGAGQQVAIV